MELKFAPATKPGPVSVTIKRRQRLVKRIDQQIVLCDAMTSGQAPRAAWAWMDDGGNYFVPIKYGRQSVELKKGMFSVLCSDLSEVEGALKTIREMVLKGELDDQLTKASADIRKKFSGS